MSVARPAASWPRAFGARRQGGTVDLFPYLLVLPAVAVLGVIFLYPLGYSVWLSFFNLNLNRPSRGMPFVGFGNYADILTDSAFYHALWLTAYWSVGSVVSQFALGLVAALALNQTFTGRAVARAVILVPWAVPTVLVAIVFSTLFNTQGIVSELLIDAGLVSDYVPWLSSADLAMPTLILANLWKGFPFVAVMLLAGLQAIPHELYEAARVDGASEWSQFRFITLPSLSSVTAVTLLLSIIFSLKSIDFQYIMTSGGPADSTRVIALDAYLTAFASFLFGKASAIATILTLLTAGVSYAYLKQRGVE